MTVKSPPTTKVQPSEVRRWVRRGFQALLVLVLFLIVGHRPILRMLVGWAGQHFAAAQGYKLEWRVTGSVLSDLSADNMRVVGPPKAAVRQLEWRKASLQYSLWNALTKGYVAGLNGFTLDDANIELDARPAPGIQSPAPVANLPDIRLQHIDLRNINARIIREDGDIVLRGFTLLLDEGKAGTFEIEELTVAATGLHLSGVHGLAEMRDRKVVLTDLVLAADAVVPHFAVDLKLLSQGSLPFEISVQSGRATIQSVGRVDDITTHPSLDLSLTVSHLASSEIARWVKLPNTVSWVAESAEVRVNGPLAEPRKLNATMSLTATDILAANMRFDSLRGQARLTNGALDFGPLEVRSGPNSLQLTAKAMLPPAWNDMTHLAADVQWQLSAPQLETITVSGDNLAGNIQGTGSASIKHGRLGQAQASLHGTQLNIYGTSFASLNLEVNSDAETIHMKSLDIHLDDQNSAVLSGEVNLADRQHAAFAWEANIGNLASMAGAAGMKDSLPDAKKFVGSGTIDFDIADVAEGKLENIKGKGAAEIDGLAWQERRIENATLEVLLHDGRIDLSKLDLRLDAQSTISIAGDMRLAERQAVNLRWHADMENLGSLFQWTGSNDIPETGKLTAEGSASISLADLREQKYEHATAEGVVALNAVKWHRHQLENSSLAFGVANGHFKLKSFDVRLDSKNKAHITADIGLADRMLSSLEWQVEFLNLAGVAPWLGMKDAPLPSAGNLVSRGSARGALADLREQNYKDLKADCRAQMTGVIWQNAPLDFAAVDLSCHEARVDVKQLEVRLNDRNHLSVVGHAMLDESGEFDAEASGNLEDLADFSGWMELFHQPRITSGRASLAWKGNGNIAKYEITGNGSLNVTNLKIAGQPDALAFALETRHAGHRAEISKLEASAGKLHVETSMSITDTDLTIPKLVFSSDKERLVEGSAEVPLLLSNFSRTAVPLDGARPLKVHLHTRKLDVDNLFRALGQKAPLMGSAAMDLDLDGTLPELNGRLSATLSDARLEATKNKLEPALVQIDATLARNQLAIKATVRQKPLQTLTADAALTFDGEKVVAMPSSILNAPLTAHITLPDSDLSVLPSFVPALASIKGTASMEAHVSGPLRQPEWQGAIRADAIRATLKDSDLDIRDIKVRASFKGQIITLDDVSTSLSGGRMTAGGTVDITQLSDPALNLQLKSKEALIVRDDTMSMRADGDLTCSGTLSKAVVAGRVELVRGRVFKEIEFLPLSLPDQLPPPPPLVRTSTAKLSAPGPFGQWNLNMDIVTRDPIRLLGNVLNGAAVVNLHVSGTGAVPVLEGKISQQGAHVRLPFSNLALSRGDIIFTKERPFEPMLDLQGDSLVSNYQVTLYATGPAANPTLRFASSPPLTEPEIATLLATGATAGNAQTTGGVAANRLAFMVLSKAYHKLFSKAEPIRKVEEPGRLSLSLNPLSTGTTPGSFDATYEVNPQVQAKIGLGEHGVRGQLSYLIRFR